MSTPTVEALKAKYQDCLDRLIPTKFDRTYQDLTIYQYLETIGASAFLALLKRHPPIQELLQANEKEHTLLLAPDINWLTYVESAGDNSSELYERLCLHISPHYIEFPDGVLHMNNLPTLLRPSASNGPQVLSTQQEGQTWTLGKSARLIKENIACTNGLVHHISNLTTVPADFESVLENHKLERFLKALGHMGQGLPTGARTVFAPNDQAFQDLGQNVLSFLFDTHEGAPYLRAMIEYHCVAEQTILTNFVWPKNDTGDSMTSKDAWPDIKGQQTRNLPTMLMEEQSCTIALKITRYNRMIELTVNDLASVVVPDVATNGGVLHVLDKVLLPRKGVVLEGNVDKFMECFELGPSRKSRPSTNVKSEQLQDV